MLRSKEDLEGVPGDSTDIFQRKMLDEYLDRPDATFKSGKFAYLDSSVLQSFYLTTMDTVSQKKRLKMIISQLYYMMN